MTTLLTRVAPSPVPVDVPHDVSDNVWVQSPERDEMRRLFDGIDWQDAAECPSAAGRARAATPADRRSRAAAPDLRP